MIKGLAFVEIVVVDFNASLKWYTEVLGLQVHKDQDGKEEIISNEDGLFCQLETSSGKDTYMALWQPPTVSAVDSAAREHPVFYPIFAVKGLNEYVGRLRAAGVKFPEEGDIRQRPDYRITTILDLERNKLQLYELDVRS